MVLKDTVTRGLGIPGAAGLFLQAVHHRWHFLRMPATLGYVEAPSMVHIHG